MNTKDTLICIVLIALTAELEEQTADNAALREKLEAGLSDAELERLARERLGLVKPGDKIFYFTTDREG